MINYLKFLALIFPVLSCAQYDRIGYSFELSDYELVENGNSKEEVVNRMGYPSFTLNISDKKFWIFFSSIQKKYLFFKPILVEQRIVSMEFDKSNVVVDVSEYFLKERKKVKINLPDFDDFNKVK